MRLNQRVRQLLVIGVVMLLALTAVGCKKATPETLSEILDRAANVTLVKYDYAMTGRSSTGVELGGASGKVWVKQNKMRVESTPSGGMFAGYLIDLEARTIYMWTPPENKLVEIKNAWEAANFNSPMLLTDSIALFNPQIVGSEAIDGKVCLVVEYVPGETARGKAWIWKEHPFLVRMELTQAEGTVTTEFKNIEFGDIPDSIFVLP